jgi:hypothetical protein
MRRLEPKLESLWNGRCWVRATLGQLQAALLDCDAALLLRPGSALRLDPKLASAFYGRGLKSSGYFMSAGSFYRSSSTWQRFSTMTAFRRLR